MPNESLIALPVYNEAGHVKEVLDQVSRYSREILVVDDGSTDGTSRKLSDYEVPGSARLHVERHEANRGYGAALQTAFAFAIRRGYEIVVTIDCDGQHEPQRIPLFLEAAEEEEQVDIVSGSRYLRQFPGQSRPPEERRRINEQVTRELNRRLGLNLTDAFCGFKAYRTAALARLSLTEKGYAMPLELWVQAAHRRLRIVELPVPLVYLEEARSFGGSLDNSWTRLEYYHLVLDRSLAALEAASAREGGATLCPELAG